MSGFIYSVTLEVLSRYREKAEAVLKAAVKLAARNRERGTAPGDFEFRELVRELREAGIEYNPSSLLTRLERDYGIIERTLRTSTQKWWRFRSLEEVVMALKDFSGEDDEVNEVADPEEALLELKVRLVDIDSTISRLKALAQRGRLGRREREELKKIVMNELTEAVKVLKEVEEYGAERFTDFGVKVRLAIKLAMRAAAPSVKSNELELALDTIARTAR